SRATLSSWTASDLHLLDLLGCPSDMDADALRAVTTALGVSLPGIVHQHTTHDLHRQRQELLAAFPLEGALASQADEASFTKAVACGVWPPRSPAICRPAMRRK